MDKKVVYGLVQRLNLMPTAGSKLAVFLSRLDNQSAEVDDPSISIDQDENTLINNSDQEIIHWLKRMQIITLTRPILELSIQAQTPLELNKAKSAGVESLIYIPDEISRKLNSLETALKSSLNNFTEIKETSTEELNKKFNLVVPPTGLEISVVLTLVVAAFTILSFVILKSEDMLGSPEAYWGFFSAGILTDITGSGATQTVDVDLSELTASTTNGDGDYFVVLDTSNNQKKLSKGSINISGFN